MIESDYQVGDIIRTTTATVVDLPGRYRVRVRYHDDTEAVYHTDYVELVERPKRELRVGSVWEHEAFGMRYIVARDSDGQDALILIHTHGKWAYARGELSIDTHPDRWREVPVEELEREAADGS